MQHFKEFLLKVQTLDIQVRETKSKSNGNEHVTYNYGISHESPFLNVSFKNRFKELKELAVTDILNLPREQILYQLHRLTEVKEAFQRFWNKYYHLEVPIGSEHNLEVVYSLRLNDIFISPELTFVDHAQANDNFIDDLESTIRFRQAILQEFEQAVSKVIILDQQPASSSVMQPAISKIKPRLIFKEGIADEFFTLMKYYFEVEDHERLITLLASTEVVGEPLVFNGAGNQLADAFKQLFDSNLIAGCNKAELEKWIKENFRYWDKGFVKSYTEKYLQDMISSNTKACQSPLFNVRRIEGKLGLFSLPRNNKNFKK